MSNPPPWRASPSIVPTPRRTTRRHAGCRHAGPAMNWRACRDAARRAATPVQCHRQRACGPLPNVRCQKHASMPCPATYPPTHMLVRQRTPRAATPPPCRYVALPPPRAMPACRAAYPASARLEGSAGCETVRGGEGEWAGELARRWATFGGAGRHDEGTVRRDVDVQPCCRAVVLPTSLWGCSDAVARLADKAPKGRGMRGAGVV